MKSLEAFDNELYQIIQKEEGRQNDKLELIASENIVSKRIQEVTGSVLTNKYAEGYPGKRYYGGCEFVDEAEQLAIDRAKEIFGADHANVQAHSGSQANMAVYMAALEVGDTVLGMDLAHGGHLTHGCPVNFSGLQYNVIPYQVRKDTQRIDYDQVRDLAKKNSPKMIIAGGSAYPRSIDFKLFREICDEVGAILFVDMAHIAGLVAGGVHENPVPYADFCASTTHKTLRGPRGGLVLCKEEHAKKLNSRIFPGMQGGPLCHAVAAKAVAFKEIQSQTFKDYSKQVVDNAQALAKGLVDRGFNLTTGGTDNHLMLIDLTNKEVTGKAAQLALDAAQITVNKNTVPFETRSPFVTSGIRLGTPALTSRGLKEADMETVAEFINRTINNIEDEAALAALGEEVKTFSRTFPHFEDKF